MRGVLLALVALAACTAPAPRPSAAERNVDYGAAKRTQAGRYLVGLQLEPEPPPLGELFQAKATVAFSDGLPIETAQVVLDARMPQHDHGMETRPRVRPGACEADTDTDGDTDRPATCRHPGGVYVADGFKFHMSGAWTVLVQVDGPKGPDSTTFVYQMP